MDDELAFASHITKRGRIYQYIRRVPDDLADVFPFARIQRSLRTSDRAAAYAAGSHVHAEFEKHFTALRRKKGAAIGVIPTDDWTWSDWSQLAEWFKATLIEDDWRARLKGVSGAVFDAGAKPKQFWRDDQTVSAHLDLRGQLSQMTLETYGQERFNFVQSAVRPLGVPLSRTSPYFERFMAACLKAEMQYLVVFFEREGGRVEEHKHPDAIEGRWRLAAQKIFEQNTARLLGFSTEKSKSVGRTLTQALEQWKTERRLANKTATSHGVGEKEKAIEEFEAHAKVHDIGEITRAHIVSFRDYLAEQKYKSPTINKKVGQITTLLTTAQKAGWIETAISGGVYIEIPAGTNEREPFERSELQTIFSQPVFSENQFSENAKAGGILEFWLPLISVVSGMISSEIFQIGPDTVGPHPDHPEIICFCVTNAGGRSVKSFARKRYVPVRRELWDNGLKEVVEKARREDGRSLWPAVARAKSVSSLSNMFSAFWSDFLRNKAGIGDPAKALYSLRHNFRDAIAEAGGADFERDQLMGHAEQGTGRKYGTKKKPRVVNIVRLNRLVQQPRWDFLSSICWPNT